MVTFTLDGKRALVTGANKGLGQSIARTLTELGATVYGTSRTETGATQIESDLGTPGLILDIQNTASIAPFIDSLPEHIGGGIDILINNAGVNHPAPALDVTEEQWDAVTGTNLKGTFFLTQALARTWVAAGMRESRVCPHPGRSRVDAVNSVRTNVGATVLTRMPWGAHSMASTLVS